MTVTRRQFSLLTAAAFAGFAQYFNSGAKALNIRALPTTDGYGPLIKDPAGLLDLPEGFRYKIISELGQVMSDGFPVPDRADGMGCFEAGVGRVALVRNHELAERHGDEGAFKTRTPEGIASFDQFKDGTPLPGGTTTLIYNLQTQTLEKQFISLAGTLRNCAGGATPWGSWLSCEESVSKAGDGLGQDHGWVFEVPASATKAVKPIPLKAMGRFNHEAVAVDPRTGIVYLTEDRDDSLFYRFIPNTPGKFDEGGRLQAMSFITAEREQAGEQDSRNWEGSNWSPNATRYVKWLDLTDTDSPLDDLRQRGHAMGATLFARGEGIHWGDGELYFCCTSGGAKKLGQIMRYRPSLREGTQAEADNPGEIQLFLESDDPERFNFGDNLTVAPNGHLFVCEDQYTKIVDNHIRGVSPAGAVYDFAKLGVQTESAGACFSPDGQTFFVNLYKPAKTLAISGPWELGAR